MVGDGLAGVDVFSTFAARAGIFRYHFFHFLCFGCWLFFGDCFRFFMRGSMRAKSDDYGAGARADSAGRAGHFPLPDLSGANDSAPSFRSCEPSGRVLRHDGNDRANGQRRQPVSVGEGIRGEVNREAAGVCSFDRFGIVG